MWDTQTPYGTFSAPQADKEIGRHGLESTTPIKLTVQPISGGDYCPNLYQRNVMKEGLFCPGNYRLRLLLLDPDSTAVGQRVFKITIVSGVEGEAAGATTVDVFKESGGKNRLLERVFPVTLQRPAKISLTLTPVKGKAVISGLVLERIGDLGATAKSPDSGL
jgi:hypothetical protein